MDISKTAQREIPRWVHLFLSACTILSVLLGVFLIKHPELFNH